MASFELAIPTVLENEGGYVNDPTDAGGETNFGISKRSYPNVDIKNLTQDAAVEIYRRDFWKFDGITDQAVATKLLDSYVNMKNHGIKAAQLAAGVEADGVFGPYTEQAINAMPGFLSKFKSRLVAHYEEIVESNPDDAKFLKGWLRRAQQ